MKRSNKQVLRAAKKENIKLGTLSTQISKIADMLRGDSTLSRKMRNNVTWIANSQFESRLMGAYIDAFERDIKDLDCWRKNTPASNE